jgi:hypothetical protein
MTEAELDDIEAGIDPAIVPFTVRADLRALVAEVRRLRAACQYAAGSFAQVPRTQTVPPIVLHDCRDKLEEALAPPAAE